MKLISINENKIFVFLVASMERNHSTHEKKTKQIEKQFELLKLQNEQNRKQRDQQNKLLSNEKVH